MAGLNRTNERSDIDATAIIGLMVGFLVVGVIGIYIGNEMVRTTSAFGTPFSSDVSLTNQTQTTIAETMEIGITLAKIMVIISVASIVFELLTRTGLIPEFSTDNDGYSRGNPYRNPEPQPSPRPTQRRDEEVSTRRPTQVTPQQQPEPKHVPEHVPTRWESIDLVTEDDK